MIRQFLVAVTTLALAAGAASAQTKVTSAPAQRTAIDGKTMFHSYCAVCHGTEGKGDGPAAKALKKTSTDLTKISFSNGGAFPDVRVRRYIEGLDEVDAHGSRDMPIWGGVFKAIDRDMAQIRIATLVEYVKTLQTK
jgi:mono/diheme cytochrome c family protein